MSNGVRTSVSSVILQTGIMFSNLTRLNQTNNQVNILYWAKYYLKDFRRIYNEKAAVSYIKLT
jgi:hypothetical protein